MNKVQLLAKAIREYPEGTVHTGYKSFNEFTVKGELNWVDDDIFSEGSGCIYHGDTNTWAPIISKPEQRLSYTHSFDSYSTKAAAENYIKCNKPCLTLTEVLQIMNTNIAKDTDVYEDIKDRLQKLVKQRIK